jgi:4-diphosphocytidyl-2-C-methyl-D-erythritol kinase
LAMAFLHLLKSIDSMLIFPNAKINLGLKVLEKRNDGYHSIETIFLPVDLCDCLEFTESESSHTSVEISGIEIQGSLEDNLVMKAWQIMHKHHNVPFIQAHLHKNIPIGAGLGGGSSDAAFMLKGINDYFNCGCSLQQLKNYASELGSDCAFFITNTPSIGTGRGEKLEEIDFSLPEYEILLVNPGIHIGTCEAYLLVNPGTPKFTLKKLVQMPVEMWQKEIVNDFELHIFRQYPLIANLKYKLMEMGAVYASMSGSGSTVYGIFRKDKSALVSDPFNEYYSVRVSLIAE